MTSPFRFRIHPPAFHPGPASQGTKRRVLKGTLLACIAFILVVSAHQAWGAEVQLPALRFRLDDVEGPKQISGVLQIVFLLTIVSL